ncbi:hypothetical protein V2O64_10345 [Verrucomicrobiaceae bacterium 227]
MGTCELYTLHRAPSASKSRTKFPEEPNKKRRIGGEVVDYDSSYDTCSGKNVTNFYLNIEGDLNSGFSGRRSEERGRWDLKCRHVRAGGGRDKDEEISKIENLLLSGVDKEAESIAHDHKGIIAELNKKRTKYHDSIRKINQLKILKDQISGFRKAIDLAKSQLKIK